jgi:hypothetical protein
MKPFKSGQLPVPSRGGISRGEPERVTGAAACESGIGGMSHLKAQRPAAAAVGNNLRLADLTGSESAGKLLALPHGRVNAGR